MARLMQSPGGGNWHTPLDTTVGSNLGLSEAAAGHSLAEVIYIPFIGCRPDSGDLVIAVLRLQDEEYP